MAGPASFTTLHFSLGWITTRSTSQKATALENGYQRLLLQPALASSSSSSCPITLIVFPLLPYSAHSSINHDLRPDGHSSQSFYLSHRFFFPLRFSCVVNPLLLTLRLLPITCSDRAAVTTSFSTHSHPSHAEHSHPPTRTSAHSSAHSRRNAIDEIDKLAATGYFARVTHRAHYLTSTKSIQYGV
jgi:hypothetical protein